MLAKYIVSARNRTVNLVEGQSICARQSLASALSAFAIVATSYRHPSRHANLVTPCLLTLVKLAQ